MAIRTKKYYNDLFVKHDLKIVYTQFYPNYTALCGTIMEAENVFVVTPRALRQNKSNKNL